MKHLTSFVHFYNNKTKFAKFLEKNAPFLAVKESSNKKNYFYSSNLISLQLSGKHF